MSKEIQKFVREYARAAKQWQESAKSYSDWLVFYEGKMQLFRDLLEKHPEFSVFEYFWNTVRYTPESSLSAILDHDLQVLKKGTHCIDCRKLVQFPAERCGECAEAYEQLRKERAEVRKQMKTAKRKARK